MIGKEPSIVAFTPLYCRFITALQLDFPGFGGFGDQALSLSDRNCRIRRSGGPQ
jgi:hypothetical protein